MQILCADDLRRYFGQTLYFVHQKVVTMDELVYGQRSLLTTWKIGPKLLTRDGGGIMHWDHVHLMLNPLYKLHVSSFFPGAKGCTSTTIKLPDDWTNGNISGVFTNIEEAQARQVIIRLAGTPFGDEVYDTVFNQFLNVFITVAEPPSEFFQNHVLKGAHDYYQEQKGTHG